MRYRQLDANGDYVIGQPFLQNTPETVGQAVLTRLKLWAGEWFANTADGLPWVANSSNNNAGALGKTYGNDPNVYIKNRILTTPGVTGIVSYSSSYSGSTRTLTVTVTISTQYDNGSGSNQTTVSTTLGQ